MNLNILPRVIACIYLWFLLFQSLLATTYYISSAGNNNHSGVQPNLAWKTIDKLNREFNLIDPGDSILFRRGDTFLGQINLSQQGEINHSIFIGAYGKGQRPIISGAVKCLNWKQFDSRIWVSQIKGHVKQLFWEDQHMPLAQFPNQTYLKVASVISNESIQTDLPARVTNYWTGAQLHIRTSAYSWESIRIKSSSDAGILELNSSIEMESPNEGFIDNLFAELDSPGEWYYDSLESQLYFYPPEGFDLSLTETMASIYPYGIKGNWDNKYVIIKGLHFQHQWEDGIWLLGEKCQNIQVSNCAFDRIGKRALHLMGNQISIKNNFISDCNGQGIMGYSLTDSEISNNEIKDIGLFPGYGINGIGGMTGIFIDKSKQVQISSNSIIHIGYNGITCNAKQSLVSKNIIRSSLQYLNDGAGIYCWGSSSSELLIQDNILLFTGTQHKADKANLLRKHIYGIYLDNNVSNVIVDGNTISDSQGSGILINADAHDNKISNNIVYNASLASLEIAEWNLADQTRNNLVSKNTFISLSPRSSCVQLQSVHNTNQQIGTFEHNTYLNPDKNKVLTIGDFKGFKNLSFSQWKDWQPSQNIYSRYQKVATSSGSATASIRIMYNDTFLDKVIIPPPDWRELDGGIPADTILLSPLDTKIYIQ